MEGMKERGGYWTSADHMMCSDSNMNLYFLTPPVAGCYQDDDPTYANSDFNNFSRVDKFDSDLWNNDERFTPEEVERCMKEAGSLPLQIKETLIQVAEQQLSWKYPEESKSILTDTIGQSKQEEFKPKLLNFITAAPSPRKKRFVCLKDHSLVGSQLYEGKWLEELFGKEIPLEIDFVS